MSKYCQNCGTQMDDNAMFCSNCGFKVVNVAENQQVKQPFQETKEQYQQPIQQRVGVLPKKKSKKKPILISVIAVALVAVLAFGGFTLYGKFFKSDDNENNFVVNKDGKTIYFGYQPMVLDGNSISEIDVFDESGEEIKVPILQNSINSTSDGNTIYYRTSEEPYLNKLTYKDGKFNSSKWVDSSLLDSKDNISVNNKYIGNIYYLQYSNDYIYFNTAYLWTNLNNSLERAFRIGRISKDGKSIEMLNDQIHASAYTISDGWIYYFDNGFVDNEIQKDRVGLYRAKEDGSNKEKIYSDFQGQSDNTNKYNELCKNIQLVGDYIYFVDYSANGLGKVCRINKDGSNYQVISKYTASNYTINEDSNTLYYVLGDKSATGEDIIIHKVYEKQIDTDNEEKELMDCISADDVLQYYDNCLYVSSSSFTFNNSGQRYNFDKSKKEVIHGVNDGGGVQELDDGTYGIAEGEISFEWINDDNK